MIFINSAGKRKGSGNSGRSGGDDHTEDSDSLWSYVTRDVRPLKKERGSSSGPAAQAIPAVRGKMPADPPLPAAKTAKRPPKPAPAAPGSREVDRRTNQKLRRGQYPIDMTIDLHGDTQESAHKRLNAAIRKVSAAGGRCLLVITGKGKGGEGQGVLRRRVPEWLQDEALAPLVLRWHNARPEDGGAGALYVLLRRKRGRGGGGD